MKKIKILLADDHPMLRQGLRTLLDGQRAMQVVGEAANGKEVLALAAELRPDIVVMDLSMPELNGLQATEQLHSRCPQVKVIALTAHDDVSYLAEVCRAGAAGYVLKRAAGEALVKAIETVAQGGVCFDPNLAGKALARQMAASTGKRDLPNQELSEREEGVLRLVAWGYSNKEIADELGVSVKTIETYKLRLSEKLGLRSRTQLVQYALRRGWLSDEQAPERLGR